MENLVLTRILPETVTRKRSYAEIKPDAYQSRISSPWIPAICKQYQLAMSTCPELE